MLVIIPPAAWLDFQAVAQDIKNITTTGHGASVTTLPRKRNPNRGLQAAGDL